jgi:hypothetical protein
MPLLQRCPLMSMLSRCVLPVQKESGMPEVEERNTAIPQRRINIQLRFTRYEVPPLRDALIIGKRAPIGANSISRAFEELSPGAFTLIRPEHRVVEAVLIRTSDLRKLPQQELLSRLLRQADQMMDESDTLHVALDFEIIVDDENIEV